METTTNTTQLTELEKEVLLAVYYSDYQDRNEPVDNQVWYLEAADVQMKPEQLSGAISSCVKKEFVGIAKDGKDSTIWLTKEGFDRIREFI